MQESKRDPARLCCSKQDEEIACEDLDKNGEEESIIKIAGKSYLLKYDTKGKPAICLYKIQVKECEQE